MPKVQIRGTSHGQAKGDQGPEADAAREKRERAREKGKAEWRAKGGKVGKTHEEERGE